MRCVVGGGYGAWTMMARCDLRLSLSLSARSLFYHFAPTLFLEAKDWHTGRRQAGQLIIIPPHHALL